LYLTFEVPDYHTTLVNSFFNDPSYRIPASVILHGETHDSVGARYKGNSTFCLPNDVGNAKVPYNLDFNYWISGQKIMGYKKLKLANAWLDPTFSKEFSAAQIYKNYLPCPEVNLLKLHVQGDYLGLYVNTESVNKQFLEKHFNEKSGVLFKCDPAGMFCGSEEVGEPNLLYLGNDSTDYYDSYTIKSDSGWAELMELINTLNFNAEDLGNVLNIDRVLWAFAVNTVISNYDTYNGYYVHNYYLYQTEDGLFQMIPWDLSESFIGAIMGWSYWNPSDVYEFDPYFGSDPIFFEGSFYDRPLTQKLFNDPIYRKQYTAHIRTVINEALDAEVIAAKISQLQELAYDAAYADPNKLFNMSLYSLNVQEAFWADWGFAGIISTVNARKDYLQGHSEINMIPPSIGGVAVNNNYITAEVSNVTSVDLMVTLSEYNSKFEPFAMSDDGQNGDLVSGDGIYTAPVPNLLTDEIELKFYIRAQNSEAMALSPERAEYEFYIYSKDLGLIGEVANNPNKKLLRIVDVLGRNCQSKTNQILFYIYDDGSVEKFFSVE